MARENYSPARGCDTLETRATPALRPDARWRLNPSRGVVGILDTPSQIIGWITLHPDGHFIACPRVGAIRCFSFIESAATYIETFTPGAA